jgi:AI-2 transport protein TqsA
LVFFPISLLKHKIPLKKKKKREGGRLVSVAAFVVVMAGAMASTSILTPMLLAFFVAVVSLQPVLWLTARKVNHALAVGIVLVGVLAIIGGIGVLLGNSINNFAQDSPIYAKKLQDIGNGLIASLDERGFELANLKWDGVVNPGKIFGYTANLLTGFGAIMGNALLVLFIVLFMMLERGSIRLKAEVIAKRYNNNLKVMTAIIESMRSYLSLKTVISLITAVFIWLWLLVFGVEYALLWALIAFLLNYIPNIGSIIAAVPTVLFALVQLGFAGAGWTLLGYLIVNTLVGNVIEPRMMGKEMGLSTLIVFLSLVFWGFILGTVGMFLAVPLTMTFKIILDQYPKTKWISILLGSDEHALALAQEAVEEEEEEGD